LTDIKLSQTSNNTVSANTQQILSESTLSVTCHTELLTDIKVLNNWLLYRIFSWNAQIKRPWQQED